MTLCSVLSESRRTTIAGITIETERDNSNRSKRFGVFFITILPLFAALSFPLNSCIAKGTPRTLAFAGLTWEVKAGIGLGPGNNNWSDDPQSVWVDDAGKLHLKIRKVGNRWYSAQVNAVGYTTYGVHRFYVETPTHNLDQDVVLGLFLYRDDDHELDVEISRKGQPQGENAKFAVQPYFRRGHRESFNLIWDGPALYEINWQPAAVYFASREGHDLSNPLIHEWRYEGGDIPQASDRLRIQINLWLAGGAPADGQEVEVVIADLDTPATSN
jgi:hypothetical protein